jgi:soluble lytic murein transglycosylase-like protein
MTGSSTWAACVLGVVAPVVVGGQLSAPPTLEGWTTKYDAHFRKHSRHYFGPGFDWRWFKAQAVVESGLKPVVRGRRGSRGIMQIKRSTFRTLKKEEPHFLNIADPEWNIAAGIYYDRLLFDQWDDRTPLVNRLCFTFGSYNAGPSRIEGSVKRARQSGRAHGQWEQVAPYAPKTTRRYVRQIRDLVGKAPPHKAAPAARAHTRT